MSPRPNVGLSKNESHKELVIPIFYNYSNYSNNKCIFNPEFLNFGSKCIFNSEFMLSCNTLEKPKLKRNSFIHECDFLAKRKENCILCRRYKNNN